MGKILIVEDDRVLLDMYKTKLQNGNFEVLTALDGQEGYNLALSAHPNLILLDIAMPKMDGMTVMRKLREDEWGKKVPIVILTNFDTDENKIKQVNELQPAYYLLKVDTTPESVLDMVKEILKNQPLS